MSASSSRPRQCRVGDRKRSLLGVLLATCIGITDAGMENCVLSARKCTNFPQFDNAQFADRFGEDLVGVENSSACLRRAEDFHHWCGNGRETEKPTVAATYVPSGDTQIYFPTACDQGWSFYNGHCYVHVWRAKTWWEAETWCNKEDAHLCSVHGKAENEFVFTLTKGLSSWIGYHDVDQDEKKEWSDNSKTDYENMSQDCSGREDEEDCSPKEQAQKWHDWNGADRGTWVCKKPAKVKVPLLRNTALADMPGMHWDGLRVKARLQDLPSLPASVASGDREPLKEVRKGIDLEKGPLPAPSKESCTGECAPDESHS